jgi:hypothetical protein
MNNCSDCGSTTNLFGVKYRRIGDDYYYDGGRLTYRCGKCLPGHIDNHNKPLVVKMRTI